MQTRTKPTFSEITAFLAAFDDYMGDRLTNEQREAFLKLEEEMNSRLQTIGNFEVRGLIVQLHRARLLDEKFYQSLDNNYLYVDRCLMYLNTAGIQLQQSDVTAIARLFSSLQINKYHVAWHVERVLEFAEKINFLRQDNYAQLIMDVFKAAKKSSEINMPHTLNWLYLSGVLDHANFVAVISTYLQADTNTLENLHHMGHVLRGALDAHLDRDTHNRLVPLLIPQSKKIKEALDYLEMLVEYKLQNQELIMGVRRRFFRRVVETPDLAMNIARSFWEEIHLHKDAGLQRILNANRAPQAQQTTVSLPEEAKQKATIDSAPVERKKEETVEKKAEVKSDAVVLPIVFLSEEKLRAEILRKRALSEQKAEETTQASPGFFARGKRKIKSAPSVEPSPAKKRRIQPSPTGS